MLDLLIGVSSYFFRIKDELERWRCPIPHATTCRSKVVERAFHHVHHPPRQHGSREGISLPIGSVCPMWICFNDGSSIYNYNWKSGLIGHCLGIYIIRVSQLWVWRYNRWGFVDLSSYLCRFALVFYYFEVWQLLRKYVESSSTCEGGPKVQFFI
jgi:hypothetical protein